MCVSGEMWHRQVDMLLKNQPDKYSLLLIDNRDVGGSARCQQLYSLDTLARDAWAVIDVVFGREEKVHVVGHSMGSFIAMRMAVIGERKKRIASLSLMAGNLGGWWWSNVPSFGLCRMVMGMLGKEEEQLVGGFMALHYTQKWLRGERWERYLKRYLDGRRKERKTGGGMTFWKHLRCARSHGLTDIEIAILRDATFPKLVVYGKEDVVVVPRASIELADKINAEAVGVEGAHFMVEESDTEVTELLRLHVQRGEQEAQKAAIEPEGKKAKHSKDEGGLAAILRSVFG